MESRPIWWAGPTPTFNQEKKQNYYLASSPIIPYLFHLPSGKKKKSLSIATATQNRAGKTDLRLPC